MRALLLAGLFLLHSNYAKAKIQLHNFEENPEGLFRKVSGVEHLTPIATEYGTSLQAAAEILVEKGGTATASSLPGQGGRTFVTNNITNFFNAGERSLASTPGIQGGSSDAPSSLTTNLPSVSGGSNVPEGNTGSLNSGSTVKATKPADDIPSPVVSIPSLGNVALPTGVLDSVQKLKTIMDDVVGDLGLKYKSTSASSDNSGAGQYVRLKKEAAAGVPTPAPVTVAAAPVVPTPTSAPAPARQSTTDRGVTRVTESVISPQEAAMFPVAPPGTPQKPPGMHAGAPGTTPASGASTTATAPGSGTSGGGSGASATGSPAGGTGGNPASGNTPGPSLEISGQSTPSPTLPSCSSACAQLKTLYILATVDRDATGKRKYILSAGRTPVGPYLSEADRINKAHDLLHACTGRTEQFGDMSGISGNKFSIEIQNNSSCGRTFASLEGMQSEGPYQAPQYQITSPAHRGPGNVIEKPATVEPAGPITPPDSTGM